MAGREKEAPAARPTAGRQGALPPAPPASSPAGPAAGGGAAGGSGAALRCSLWPLPVAGPVFTSGRPAPPCMGRGGGRPPPAAMAEPPEEDELPVPGEWCRLLTEDGFARPGGGNLGRLWRSPPASPTEAALGAITGAPTAASLPRPLVAPLCAWRPPPALPGLLVRLPRGAGLRAARSARVFRRLRRDTSADVRCWTGGTALSSAGWCSAAV